ncbi:MAG: LPS export ABC transporter ATP-binding protein [Planctomycetota bacterium]|nr:LPS export ABC transporter ATP-binding protein [Planctomycetota bacterium]
MPLLTATNLVKSYGGRRVVDEVCIEVGEGEVVGLLGPNGAGKTTSFRMMIGMVEPEAGRVLFDGEDVTHLPMYQHARRGMGYLAQEPSVFRGMTCEDNLNAILETLPIPKPIQKQRCDELLEQFHLEHKRKQLAKTCSGGERRRLEIARALIMRPKLILLDEPFAAVDPHTVEDVQKEVRKLTEQGISILVTDHAVQQTLHICDRAYIIDSGKNLMDGDPKTIINDELVKKRYLASTFRGDEFDE